MKQKKGRKLLSFLLSLALVLGLMPGMSLTAYAAEGTKLTGGGTLSAGTYYLDSDLNLTQKISITSGNVILNLNGHTLTGNRNDTVISVTGGSLIVNDGTITGGIGETNWENNSYRRGGGFAIRGGEVTVNNVTITGNQAHWGGGVIVASGGTFTMNNSTISNNETKNYSDWNDGGAAFIQDNGSTFIMNGGSITNNTSENGKFCGVSVHSGTFKVSGNAVIRDNVYNGQQKNFTGTITVNGELTSGANIGVTHNPGVFTNTSSENIQYNDASKFTSDNNDYTVIKNTDGQLELGSGYTVTYRVVNGTWSDDSTTDKTENVNNGSKPANVPTGMKAFQGYKKSGTWDLNPAETTITQATTFIYTFEKKAAINPTVSIDGWTYGKAAKTPSVTGNTGNGDVTYSYAKKDTTDFSATVPSDAGEYTIKAVIAETDDYLGNEATKDFTIAKVDPTVTAPEANTLTYTGSEQELVNAGTATGGTMYYAVTTEETAPDFDGTLESTDKKWNTSIPKATTSGT